MSEASYIQRSLCQIILLCRVTFSQQLLKGRNIWDSPLIPCSHRRCVSGSSVIKFITGKSSSDLTSLRNEVLKHFFLLSVHIDFQSSRRKYSVAAWKLSKSVRNENRWDLTPLQILTCGLHETKSVYIFRKTIALLFYRKCFVRF